MVRSDGFTGPLQERLVHQYSVSSLQLMFYSNAWGMVLTLATAVLNNEVLPALAFCQRNPEIVNDLLLFSILSAFGQYFIFIIIREFGSLAVSIVTTSRYASMACVYARINQLDADCMIVAHIENSLRCWDR
jgi:solute carrier family 35 (UDP-galactose transporter), member B1